MKNFKNTMKVSSRLSLLFIILAIFTVTGIAIYINNSSRRELRYMAARQYGVQQLMKTRLVAFSIEKYFDRFISDLHFMANTGLEMFGMSTFDALFYQRYGGCIRSPPYDFWIPRAC